MTDRGGNTPVRCICEHDATDHLTGEFIYQGADYALALGSCRARRCECDHFDPQRAVLAHPARCGADR